jgi:hypothetical protein
MKEFLTKHGVPFVSVNVLEDRTAMSELAELGVRTVPVIRRGMDWANGQVLRDVARVAGIRWGGAPILPPAELVGRLTIIQSAAQRYLRQIPDARLGDMLPNRPRSYSQLVYHTFNIADAFLEHEMQGLPLREGAYSRVQAPGSSKGQIAAYGQDVLERLGGWWDEAGNSTDYEAKAKVYYGDVTLHDFLERTTWHSGQHVRQLMMVLDKLGIQPDDPVGKDVFAGLPMPDKVWDDEKPAA